MNFSKPMTVERLEEFGFDRSRESLDEPDLILCRCSQCEALVINGHPTHERGCPNEPKEVPYQDEWDAYYDEEL